MKHDRNISREDNRTEVTIGAVTYDPSYILELVDRAADGDFETFGELYGIYLDPIYRYVFYQVNEKMTAEDITEDVFLKAWKAIASCRGRGQTFSSWLYRIAHNQVIDSFRSKRRHSSVEMEMADVTSDSDSTAEIEFKKQDLLSAMTYLPPNQRQVIILKFIEGLDNSEISNVIGKSQGAVRVLQMRALATIRQNLSEEQR
ncbi:RNA polymerase sigma factor [Chloroflexota bacterium]